MNNNTANRFPELLTVSRIDRDEDGLPEIEIPTQKCECGREFPIVELQAVNDGTDTPLFLCPSCVAEFHAQEIGLECACDIPGRTWCEEHGAIARRLREVA